MTDKDDLDEEWQAYQGTFAAACERLSIAIEDFNNTVVSEARQSWLGRLILRLAAIGGDEAVTECACVCDSCQGPTLPPTFDHIGDFIIAHGERDDTDACFCGYPYYLHCPQYIDGEDTIMNMVLGGQDHD